MSPTDPPLPPNDDEPAEGGGEPGDQARDAEAGAGEIPDGPESTEVLPPVDGAEPTEVLAATETESPSQAMRRRVSHRRYVIRRIVVLVCLLLILGGVIGLIVWAVRGDGDGEIATADSTEPTTPVESSDPETKAPRTTDESSSPDTKDAADTTEASDSNGNPIIGVSPATSDTENADGDDSSIPETSDAPEDTTDPDDTTTETSVGEVTYDLDSEPPCEIGQPLSRGDAGPQVRCLQERLNEVTMGGEELRVDGGFGEETDDAVRQLQEAHDLRVDGIVGPATGDLLGIWPEDDE